MDEAIASVIDAQDQAPRIWRLRRDMQDGSIEATVDNERMAQELEAMGYERVHEGEEHERGLAVLVEG